MERRGLLGAILTAVAAPALAMAEPIARTRRAVQIVDFLTPAQRAEWRAGKCVEAHGALNAAIDAARGGAVFVPAGLFSF